MVSNGFADISGKSRTVKRVIKPRLVILNNKLNLLNKNYP